MIGNYAEEVVYTIYVIRFFLSNYLVDSINIFPHIFQS